MWFDASVFYQIYPLGLCGAPQANGGEAPENRIGRFAAWLPHIRALGANAVLLNPVFNSDTHGYDTRDYTKIDPRLGTNEDFATLCCQMQEAGLKIVLDGVFNHVGRGFWAFQDVCLNRQGSPYKDWFFIDWDRDSNYGDGFWYDGWEGHFELVRLNLQNPAVAAHLLEAVSGWITEFGIDGLRLDVAYCVDTGFIRALRAMVDGQKPGFFLMGEMLHGDYKAIVQPGMCDSATNYECYKGLYSSLNTLNFFEIAYSLNRQFGPEDWTLYKGLPLFNFIDNHDVTRAASVLTEPRHLPLLWGMLFGMPGIPSIYYGSEWSLAGDKKDGDNALRPAIDMPEENELSRLVAKMAAAHGESATLQTGGYRQVYLTNKQFIFERKADDERYLIALNAEDAAHTAHFDAQSGTAVDMLTDNAIDFGGGHEMPPFSVQFLHMEK